MRAHAKFRPDPGKEVDVLLNFPGEPINMYQIRQWYGPLEHLAATQSVAILCYQPHTAELVAQETDLKVILAPSYTDLREVENDLKPKVILYPNQNYANYRILGITSAEHVFICHGESDKIYMASNWVKVFNYFFVAGEASRDRLRKHVRNYDVDTRTIAIGRPQIDIEHQTPLATIPNRITVIYAPTWEGGRRTMRYGSVASHGVNIVASLLDDERFRLIYRPHPRTGVHEQEFSDADNTIRELITKANAQHGAQHYIDDTPFGWQLDLADVMITDVSAVAYDWLMTAKPLIVTKPDEPEALMPNEGLIPELPLLGSQEAEDTARILSSLLDNTEEKMHLASWADYYYGDRTRGRSLHRFAKAIELVIEERDRAMTSVADFDDDAQTVRPGNSHAGQQRTRAFTALIRGLTFAHRSLNFAATGIANLIAQSHADSYFSSTPASAITKRHSEILVSTMAGPHDIDSIIDWLPSLERLNKSHPLSILVGNLRTYEKLRSLTSLRVHIGLSASETEEVFTAVTPVLHLQFEQANLNLRELTHRNVRHAYVGAIDDEDWINNRLRAFDAVVAATSTCPDSLSRNLIDFPQQTKIILFSDAGDPTQSRADVLAALLLEQNPNRDSTAPNRRLGPVTALRSARPAKQAADTGTDKAPPE